MAIPSFTLINTVTLDNQAAFPDNGSKVIEPLHAKAVQYLTMNQVEEKLLHPQPGSRIEAARAYGIDLTMLIERLRLTPEERVRDLQRAIQGLEAVRGKARRQRTPAPVRQIPAAKKDRD